MSDFLSRLVQRTRGEAATVRPVSVAVTAPDIGAAAWDERVIEHEAPLALSSRAPSPPLLQRARAAAPQSAVLTAAPARRGALDGEFGRMREVEPSPAMVPAAAAPPSSPAAAEFARALDVVPVSSEPRRQSASEETEHPALQPAAPPPAVGVAVSLVELRELHVPALSSPSALASPLPTPTRTPMAAFHVFDDTAGLLAAPSSLPPNAGTRPVPAAPGAQPTPEVRTETVSRRRMLEAEAQSAQRTDGVGAATANAMLTLERAAPRRDLERLSRAEISARSDSAAVHEHSTTVEVSIGRIEVRVPPARGPVATPAAAPRRTAMSLSEYLQSREAGKTR